jgi:AcrR family transcriptional regulator
MARTADLELRRQLLDQVVGYLAGHGLGLLSLRPMAAALGMSTNRLVHHFGTKDELIAAALARATELQEQVREGWLAQDPDISQPDLLRRWWAWLRSSPEHLALVRLGLEAVALDATVTGLPVDVRAQQIGLWRTNIEHRLTAAGLAPNDAEIEASLVKAVFTGLVLDLLASGDEPRLTEALERELIRLEARLAAAASNHNTTPSASTGA